MRIAINARFLTTPRLEGIGWYTYEIVKRMIERHPEHEYLLLYDRKVSQPLIVHPSAKAIVCRPPARHPLLWMAWFECTLPMALHRTQADVFFSPDGYCSLRTRVPQCMVVHDLAYLHFPLHVPALVHAYYRNFVPRQLQKAEHLFAVSDATRKDIIRWFPRCSGKISIAYNGVRNCFHPLDEPTQAEVRREYAGGAEYFLFVGAIHPRKNVETLVRAFGMFKSKTGSNTKLVIAGRLAWHTGNFLAELKASASRSDIIILNYLDGDTLARVTASAVAVVQPSLLEGFGVPVLEALNCDIPVIVSDRFSLPEVGGPGAFTFPAEDAHALAACLESALQIAGRESRIALGRSHRVQFDWDRSAEHIYGHLLSVARSCPSR
ncbi:MAG: D-inositol-3-phosphate glycosyltransferase [Saprospiraceae bacterium]|nr:D-inositol-3-phosphate glycosyltransferase [Saprospiraceae bacterium]